MSGKGIEGGGGRAQRRPGDASVVSGIPSVVASVVPTEDNDSLIGAATHITAGTLGGFEDEFSMQSGEPVSALSPMTQSIDPHFGGHQSTIMGASVVSEDVGAWSHSASGGPSVSAGSAVSVPSHASPPSSIPVPSLVGSDNEMASFPGESRFGDASELSGVPVSADSAPSRTYAGPDSTRFEDGSDASGLPRSAEFSAPSRTFVGGQSTIDGVTSIASVPGLDPALSEVRSAVPTSAVSAHSISPFPQPSAANSYPPSLPKRPPASATGTFSMAPTSESGSAHHAHSASSIKREPESVVSSVKPAGAASLVSSARKGTAGPASIAPSSLMKHESVASSVAPSSHVKQEPAPSSVYSATNMEPKMQPPSSFAHEYDDDNMVDDSQHGSEPKLEPPPSSIASLVTMDEMPAPTSQPQRVERKRKREAAADYTQEELKAQLLHHRGHTQTAAEAAEAAELRLFSQMTQGTQGSQEAAFDFAGPLAEMEREALGMATPLSSQHQSRPSVSQPAPQRRPATSVRIKAKENEEMTKAAAVQKYHDEERAAREVARASRKDKARKLMDEVADMIQTPSQFAIAVPQTPRYPRLVTPQPSLKDLVQYQPTQLELDWNKALLSQVDWIGVQDVDLVNPSAHGRNEVVTPHISDQDRALLQASFNTEDEREAWKGKGKVPIFTVRPAYTEVGLRPNNKKQRREEGEEALKKLQRVKEVRESVEDKRQRYLEGTAETFRRADDLDTQWLRHLVQAGASLGIGLTKNDPRLKQWKKNPEGLQRFKFISQLTLSMASSCAEEALEKLDATLLSVLPSYTSVEELEGGFVLPEVNPKLLKRDEYENTQIHAEWADAWQRWALLYATEMRDIQLSVEARAAKFESRHRRPIASVLRSLGTAKDEESELRHPTQPKANLVAVKELWVDAPEITEERELQLVQFETQDPLPLDRLCAPGEDFFELENKVQLTRRTRAPDHMYEGAVILRRPNTLNKITAEFLLPAEDLGTERAAAKIKSDEVIPASWNTPTDADGQRSCVEYDRINTFDGKVIHTRESMFVFRETASCVKLSHIPRKFGLALAPGTDEMDDPELAKQHLMLRDEANKQVRGRLNVKYIFSWDEDLATWRKREVDGGQASQYEAQVRDLDERMENDRKRRKVDQHDDDDDDAEAETKEPKEEPSQVKEELQDDDMHVDADTDMAVDDDTANEGPSDEARAGMSAIELAALAMGVGAPRANGHQGQNGTQDEELDPMQQVLQTADLGAEDEADL